MAQVKSHFIKFKDFFAKIATSIEETINGKKTAQTYLYKEMLTEELSVDLKWNTLSVDNAQIKADVVAMDSALPVKSRSSLGAANGDIPKLGTKRQLTEKQMSDIDILSSRNAESKAVVDKLFADEISCTMGIHEQLEFMFLQALSTGTTVIDDTNNVGTGVRIDFGFKDSNKFGALVPWSDPTAKAYDDLKRVIKFARSKGDIIQFVWMDDSTFDQFAANTQTREMFAFSQGFVGQNIPVPNFEQVNSMLNSNLRLQIRIVDRTIIAEKDGERTVLRPWSEGKVVFTTTNKVGKLPYGVLAEESRKSTDALYAKSGSFILLKKWGDTEPFAEYTSSQALVLPVINNVSSIYILDSNEAATDAQTEGDANFAYEGANYTRTSVIAAINLAVGSTKAKSSHRDSTLLGYVNELSEEQIQIFEANITAAGS